MNTNFNGIRELSSNDLDIVSGGTWGDILKGIIVDKLVGEVFFVAALREKIEKTQQQKPAK